MQRDETIDLPGGRFRIVDLSQPLSETGRGHTGHRLALRRGNFGFDGTYFHEVELHSHLGTHVELPRNVSLDYPDALQTPLSLGMGWMQLIDLSDLPARHVLTTDDLLARGLEKVRPGDIAGIFGGHKGSYLEPEADERVRLTVESIEALLARGIKGLCMDNSTLALETSAEECRAMHEAVLGKNLPIFENFYTLHELPADRIFLIALWLPIEELDSSPTRAVGLVPVDS